MIPRLSSFALLLGSLSVPWVLLSAPGEISTYVGTGTPGYNGDDVAATSAQINLPHGVAVDGQGNLFIADDDNNRIRRVDARTGVITTVSGTGQQGYSGDGGQAVSAELDTPVHITFDSENNLFITEIDNDVVRRVDSDTGIITSVAGTGVRGFNGDGIQATAAQLNSPCAAAIDAAGNIYIADNNNGRIRRVDAETGLISTVAGNGADGFSGDGGAAIDASINNPWGVAVDREGNLFIADTDNHRIRRVDATTGLIATIAGTGTSGSSGNGGPANGAQLALPFRLTIDHFGNLFVIELDGHQVRRIDAVTQNISLVAGNGSGGFSGDGAAATAAQLHKPTDACLDAAGNLMIADQFNHRIRKVEAVSPTVQFFLNDSASFTAAMVDNALLGIEDFEQASVSQSTELTSPLEQGAANTSAFPNGLIMPLEISTQARLFVIPPDHTGEPILSNVVITGGLESAPLVYSFTGAQEVRGFSFDLVQYPDTGDVTVTVFDTAGAPIGTAVVPGTPDGANSLGVAAVEGVTIGAFEFGTSFTGSNNVGADNIGIYTTVPPPTTLTLEASSDSGLSDSDRITRLVRPVFAGATEPGVTIKLSSNLDGLLGNSLADASGNWTLQPSVDLREGEHEISVIEGALADPLIVEIDTTSPDPPAGLDLAAGDDTGVLPNDDVTAIATPSISGEAEIGTVVALTSNLEGTVGTGTADGTWSIVASELRDGSHSLVATATDPAGNQSTSSTALDVVVDTVPPSLTIDQAATQNDPAATGPVEFTATFSEPVHGFDGSDVVAGGSLGGTPAVSGGADVYLVQIVPSGSEGTIVATAAAGAATDLAGNQSGASTSTDNRVTLDGHGGDGANATPLILEEGSATQGGWLEDNDVDVFSFTLFSYSLVDLFTTGEVDTRGVLRSSQQVVQNDPDREDDAGDGENFKLTKELRAGVYTIEVSSNTGEGDYLLHIEATATPEPRLTPDPAILLRSKLSRKVKKIRAKLKKAKKKGKTNKKNRLARKLRKMKKRLRAL